MSKRARLDDDSRPPKRAKAEQHTRQQPPNVEDIHFARQLQTLLTFRQDGIQELRRGIASFKAFLENILYHRSEDDRGRELSILREYLESQRPADLADTEKPFLSQIWQAWSFGSTNNNDQLCSSVSAILALLLKTLSGLIDFREIGIQLCRTLLQGQHLRLIKRNLDAPKHKDFLISPCLRLLIEVTSFDGGVLAKEVYKRREQTFDAATLRRCLGFTRPELSDEEAKRRPAIRTLAIRYILCHLKYLHEGGKTDLLNSRPLCSSLFHFLRDDPVDVVFELLAAVEQNVLKDESLQRSAKTAILQQHNLERVTEVATRSTEDHGAAAAALSWLKNVCSKPSYGLLRTSGWYPPGTDQISTEQRDGGTIDLGLDSIDWYDRDDKPNIRNSVLLSYLKSLRPHSNLEERKLVMQSFTSAPELVASYFAEKNIQLEPKLSNTWIGYASFVFEVVQLPVPQYVGHGDAWAQLPPQTNIMLESIFPRPLTQKVLKRCLNQNSDLITFSAIRLMIVAFEKFLETTHLLHERGNAAGSHAELWHQASTRLQDSFVGRCPSMKDIIATFRKLSSGDESALQYESVTRLLKLYYEVFPLEAMDTPLDLSTALGNALGQDYSQAHDGHLAQLRTLYRDHLLQIAARSLGMRWLSKQGSLDVSPLVRLLQLYARTPQDTSIRILLSNLLVRHDIINSHVSCDKLVTVLGHPRFVDSALVATFLDDCFARAHKQPVKYRDLLETFFKALGTDEDSASAPNLLAVFLEQLAYVVKRPIEERDVLLEFMKGYCQMPTNGQRSVTSYDEEEEAEDENAEEVTQRDMPWLPNIGELENQPKLQLKIGRWLAEVGKPGIQRRDYPSTLLDKGMANGGDGYLPEAGTTAQIHEATLPFSPPPTESENHPELLIWAKKDLGLALEDGDVSALILCLSSQYPEIRSQAIAQLKRLEEKVINSTIDDKDPIYILIGELVETYEQYSQSSEGSFPYLASSFATKALQVQTQPTHIMYPKVNKYLNKGPDWRVSRLPSYWYQHTVLGQPEEDDAYWKEIQWVLEWLVDGLRSPSDIEIMRKGGMFEKMMSLHASPGAGRQMKERVLELLYRATSVEGGSTTLITRTGVLSWLDMVAREESGGGVAGALRTRVKETCEREKVEGWSGRTLEVL